MLIAFLVMALLAAWAPSAVALVIACQFLSDQAPNTAAEGVEQLFGSRPAAVAYDERIECGVCGAHAFRTVQLPE